MGLTGQEFGDKQQVVHLTWSTAPCFGPFTIWRQIGTDSLKLIAVTASPPFVDHELPSLLPQSRLVRYRLETQTDEQVVLGPWWHIPNQPGNLVAPSLELIRTTATSADVSFRVTPKVTEVHFGFRRRDEALYHWDIQAWMPGSATTFTFAPLHPGEDYFFRLVAHTADGQEAMSEVLESRTRDQNPPNRVQFLTPSHAGMIPIRWAEIPGADRYEIYRTQREQDGADFYSPCELAPQHGPATLTTTGQLQAVDEAIEPGFFYGYTVVGIARNGQEVSRLDCRWRASPLHKPTNLQAQGLPNGEIEVSWQPSSRNRDSLHAVWYHIEYSAGSSDRIDVIPVNDDAPGSVLIPSINRQERHVIKVSAYPSISGEDVDDGIRFQQMGCQCRDFWGARTVVELAPF